MRFRSTHSMIIHMTGTPSTDSENPPHTSTKRTWQSSQACPKISLRIEEAALQVAHISPDATGNVLARNGIKKKGRFICRLDLVIYFLYTLN